MIDRVVVAMILCGACLVIGWVFWRVFAGDDE